MARENPPHAQHGEGDQPQAGGGAEARVVKQARALRKDMGLPEVLLWQRLRRRAGEVKFRRQHPVGGYILDFYCAEAIVALCSPLHRPAGGPPPHALHGKD